jgi:hypothetical protein
MKEVAFLFALVFLSASTFGQTTTNASAKTKKGSEQDDRYNPDQYRKNCCCTTRTKVTVNKDCPLTKDLKETKLQRQRKQQDQ